MSADMAPLGRNRRMVGVLHMDAEDLRTLAWLYGPRDGTHQELLELADRVDDANGVPEGERRG